MDHTIRQLSETLRKYCDKHVDIIADDREITGITDDSRKVGPGFAFIAVKGVSTDGHRYISSAIEAGASVVVYQEAVEVPAGTVAISVADSAKALGHIASWWYDFPSAKLTLLGVTGTNGKTTIATLLYEMARLMGEEAGLISTVVNKIGDTSIPATHTTPDPITINSLMARMVDAGCTFCSMEVSSHACHQQRIAGLQFDGGIFTNLTRDHLDYHGTFDNYLKAKKMFFDSLSKDAFALTNADDSHGMVMLQNTAATGATYSLRRPADFNGKILEDRLDGMLMSFDGPEIETAFTGAFNASNLLAVYAASLLCGWDKEDVLRDMSLLVPVAGRMQTIRSSGGVTAIVDYAHTPDALANVLSTIAEVKGAGAVITVAGAGGDRDKGKRPLMAAEAVKYSDMLIITSDNPRHERAEDIAADMLAGVDTADRGKVTTILDRREAIRHALGAARPGDVVLVAGKGHEDYQIIGDTRHHFDDKEEILKVFNNNNDK